MLCENFFFIVKFSWLKLRASRREIRVPVQMVEVITGELSLDFVFFQISEYFHLVFDVFHPAVIQDFLAVQSGDRI